MRTRFIKCRSERLAFHIILVLEGFVGAVETGNWLLFCDFHSVYHLVCSSGKLDIAESRTFLLKLNKYPVIIGFISSILIQWGLTFCRGIIVWNPSVCWARLQCWLRVGTGYDLMESHLLHVEDLLPLLWNRWSRRRPIEFLQTVRNYTLMGFLA